MIGAIGKAAGRRLKVQPLPWLMLRLLAPFMVTFREMQEMRYLWNEPLRLDNSKLLAVLGREPHTPLDMAVKTTLKQLHCL